MCVSGGGGRGEGSVAWGSSVLRPFRRLRAAAGGRLQERVRQAYHVSRLNARLAYYAWREQLLQSKHNTLLETKERLQQDMQKLGAAAGIVDAQQSSLSSQREALQERVAIAEIVPTLVANQCVAWAAAMTRAPRSNAN